MKLVEAKEQLLYVDPKAYIRNHLLPLPHMCIYCEAKMLIDFDNDLKPRWIAGEWKLYAECLVCKKLSHVNLPYTQHNDTIIQFCVDQMGSKERHLEKHGVAWVTTLALLIPVITIVALSFLLGPEVGFLTFMSTLILGVIVAMLFSVAAS